MDHVQFEATWDLPRADGWQNISPEGFYWLIKHKRLRQETPHLVTVDDQ